MANGERLMTNGKWLTANGQWLTANGKGKWGCIFLFNII